VRIDDIRVYPIKSCGGISLTEATLDARGLEHDRRFMVVDEHDRFVTLRTEPTLPAVELAIDAEHYRVRFPGGRELQLPVDPSGAGRRRVRVWDDDVEADEIVAASEAFSDYLHRRIRLVHLPTDVVRPVNPKRARPGDEVSFADAYPLLLMSRSSVSDLSVRVGREMDMRRFRPNLVLADSPAYEEDFFARVRIGDLTFRGPKACSRCVATTIDPITGTKSVEPLRTLAGYRRAHGEVFLGMNLIHDGPGTLRVGSAVTVTERHAERAFGEAPASSG